ncbi:MAG: OmpA family protein, partial [Defluviicoccus sp.]
AAAAARTGAAPGPAREPREPDQEDGAVDTGATAGASTDAAEAPAAPAAEPAAEPTAEPAAVPSDADGSAAASAKAACPQPVVLGFQRNSLLPAAADLRPKIADVSAWLGWFPTASLVVEGHSDSVGPDDVNRTISEQRARAIADVLIGLGLATDRITVRGLGESQLLPAFRPQAAQQRRVVLRLDGIPGCPAALAEPAEPPSPAAPVKPAPVETAP